MKFDCINQLALLLTPMLVLCDSFKFTNIECKSLDNQFVNFKKCELKVLGRGIIGVNMDTDVLYKQPITDISVNLCLYKKSNVYRPFIFNQTVDFCYYMLTRDTTAYRFFALFHNTFVAASNVNHTCPYQQDIIVNNLIIKDNPFRAFPVPSGDYMLSARVATFKVWRTEVKLYGKLLK